MQNLEIKNRGYNFLIPIGRTWTQHEEKNDVSDKAGRRPAPSTRGTHTTPQADDASEGSDGSTHSGDANSLMDEDENDSSEEEEEEDLDAEMEDMDQTADTTAELDNDEMDSDEESSDEEDSDD